MSLSSPKMRRASSISFTKKLTSPKSNSKRIEQQNKEKTKKRRQKLCSSLDAYALMIKTKAPLRCLKHNSVLSLYCQTQQKLLCANCVYGSAKHKLHRVLPIQKCYPHISRDVEQISRHWDRQLEDIKNLNQKIEQQMISQQKAATWAITDITKMYDHLKLMIQDSVKKAKQRILDEYEKSMAEKQSLLFELGVTKNIVEENSFKSGMKIEDESELLYFHLTGNTLIQLGKLDKNLFLSPTKYQSIHENEIKKVTKIKQILLQSKLG